MNVRDRLDKGGSHGLPRSIDGVLDVIQELSTAVDALVGGGGAVSSVFARVGAVVAAGGDYTAAQVTNTPAGTIAATTVQAALNELDSEKATTGSVATVASALVTLSSTVSGLVTGVSSVFSRIGAVTATAGDYTAAQVTNTPAGNIAATTVQAALNELDTEKASAATVAALVTGVSSVFSRTGAVVAAGGDYTAAQVTNTPAGNIAATTVQAALNELDTEKASAATVAALVTGVSSVFSRTGAVTATAGDYTAAQITNTAAGGIAATTVQAALNELDTEKARLDDLVSVSSGKGAALVGIQDAGNYFAGATVESALQALGAGTVGGAVTSVFTRTGAVVSANGDYTASQITNAPAGGVASITVQAAITELDNEKARLDNLSDTASGKGASLIGIQDAGGFFSGAHVESALQALGTDVSGLLAGPGIATRQIWTGVTAADVVLTAAAQQEITFKFIPVTDDVELYLLVSIDGTNYDNGANNYDYAANTLTSAANATFGSGGAIQIILQEDNGSATAGIGNGATEGVSGKVTITRKGGTDFFSIMWELEYRNAAAGALRKVYGAGSRLTAATAQKIRFIFEGTSTFTGLTSRRDL